ncbi:substrate-binding periplasmic protein [Pseudomonas panipatensis]|uniref:Polar amino acid transport system substrate-binding protein n=1 Tax=Pseudomonas panipatensis TaxID=428992 RepID=A0A1G8CJM2_9PSED|nr:transporter substrate-binding domain-containing protein [Pseudomonas panipatensis]SDH45697.1 polar amino acid transport system substrate-binding protein [Pseudomonas panipatensis]SMP64548.1 amino acid ABC transporter substrate-binding protein, PAAT family [Pseudomonas panipatensis]
MSQPSFRPRLILLLSCLSLPLGAQAASGQCSMLVATGNPEYPPFLWRDPAHPERLIGANADLLVALGKALGLTIHVRYTGSWARAQEEARLGRVDLLAGAFLTPERQTLMDYIQPAFLNTDSVVWVRKGEVFPYARWDDLRGRKGGTLVNNSFGADFDAFSRRKLMLEEVPSLAQAFQKLMLGRTDYVLYERFPGLATATRLGFAQRLQPLDPPVSSEALYLTLAHASPCYGPELRGQLQEKMTELTAAGVPRRLLQSNMQRWEAQQSRAAGTPTE